MWQISLGSFQIKQFYTIGNKYQSFEDYEDYGLGIPFSLVMILSAG